MAVGANSKDRPVLTHSETNACLVSVDSRNLEELFGGKVQNDDSMIVGDAGDALAVSGKADALDLVLVVSIILELCLVCGVPNGNMTLLVT